LHIALRLNHLGCNLIAPKC